ncbi:hypothetical protein CR203_22680 [Salipaludibacillus neizhouensis]|uniref:ABC transporter substrate-binding protein n=1 Tax=Salipaludibacillus neizhouensis TaxID=885475 RepID=A0A3A9KJK4_9BACI|nr:ABC transporter substrate-binding protein [Salipaludibacillus neizhouensis]RKL65076.1 hypothetical protein CR203_22680 [Salipaludibacillus neizhouensis]
MKKKLIYIILFLFLFLFVGVLFFKPGFDKNANNENIINILSIRELGNEGESIYRKNIEDIYPGFKVNVDVVLNTNDEIRNEAELINRIENKLEDNTYHILVGVNEGLAYSLSKEGLLRNIHSSIKPLIESYDILGTYSESVPGNSSKEAYFLPIDFRGYSLIYNKDIFERLNINEPSKNESWSNIYNLSEKINKESNGSVTPLTYGSNFPPLAFNEFLEYIAPLEIYLNDSSLENLKDLWVSFINNYRDYSMNVYDGGEFVRGNIAMVWSDTSLLYDVIEQIEQGNLLGAKSFRYKVVSSPNFGSDTLYGKVDSVVTIPQNTPDFKISDRLITLFYRDHFVNSSYSNDSSQLPIHITPKFKDTINNKYYNLDTLYPDKLKFSYTNYVDAISFPSVTLMYDSIRGKLSPEESYIQFQEILRKNSR